MTESTTILRLSALWQAKAGSRARRVAVAFAFLIVVGVAHLARIGTPLARLGGAAAFCLALVVLLVLGERARRSFLTARGVIRGVVLPTDAELGGRALRAEALSRRAEQDQSVGSPELARLHLGRVLSRVSFDAVGRTAQRYAGRRAWIAFALLTSAGAGVLVEPMRIVEGLDVLLARGGVAPLPLSWLSMTRVSVTPPTYLRASEQRISGTFPNALPQGSRITVRGVPQRLGRRIVLTDGQREEPFVDDGSENLVAHWTLKESAALRVAARFGDVLVVEPSVLELTAIADQAPRIELEGAPRTVHLRDLSRLELRFVAQDDHGLRQIDLVLRSGAHEDRRVLMRLDGQSKTEQGAHALDPRDAFLRRMFLPVVATIEGRDNDAVTSAKWGKSAAVTILPPRVGELEAARLAALEAARDRLLDLLEHQIATERDQKGRSREERTVRQKAEKLFWQQAILGLKSVASDEPAGVGVSSGLSAFLLGQARGLEKRTADPRRRTEDVLLASDAAIRALATRDAQAVSKRLGDVAEEVAEAARIARDSEQRALGIQRAELALGVLDEGTRNLVTLGTLGADLGDVAAGETRRIRRGRSADNFLEAELAGRHLAARLRRPAPSFSSPGGGGVEAGQGSSSPGESSEADRQFDQLMSELEDLAAEHAEGIRRVEQALADAERGTDTEDLKREATERARALRERLRDLPGAWAQEGSARAAAALARELAASMAQGLEGLDFKDAVDSGRSAQLKLEEAGRLAKDTSRTANWLDEKSLGEVTRELQEHLSWAEKQLARLKEQARGRAAADLASAGERESELARKAGNLAGRGVHSDAKLPEELSDALERAESAMQQAARELSEGRGDEGLELQREAQRLLERSNSGRTSDGDDKGRGRQDGQDSDGQRHELSSSGTVPAADKARRAEQFRKRVLDGLSRERRGRLGPAVERYAEDLLE